MIHDFGLFFFLAAGAVALFSFLSVAAWVEARKEERLGIERLTLYRKLAELTTPSAELILARLHEEDRQRERAEQEKLQRSRREQRQGGAIVLAVGVGLSIFLSRIAPDSAVWTLGIMVGLVGAVIVLFSLSGRATNSAA